LASPLYWREEVAGLMNPIRKLTVAAVQVESRNLDVAGNLARAEVQVAAAAQRGAELVVCPELLAAGYIYHPSIWNAAEPRGGPTELWLSRMAHRHRLYIGASYLEACGEHFYNTFALMNPDGSVAGRVRKESLPGFEGWFIRSCPLSKVIETEIGRIGVGICHDNCTGRFMRRLCREPVDLLLMPHSTPCMTMGPLDLGGAQVRQLLRSAAGFYAQAFGVPTVMSNKAAGQDSTSPIPWLPLLRLHFHFVGQSTICDADGNVADRLDEQEGVVVAEIALDPQRKHRPVTLPRGYWSRTPPLWPAIPRISATVFEALECAGKAAYRLSRSRGIAARKSSDC
jgi:N-carbamoylputrescine amidase